MLTRLCNHCYPAVCCAYVFIFSPVTYGCSVVQMWVWCAYFQSTTVQAAVCLKVQSATVRYYHDTERCVYDYRIVVSIVIFRCLPQYITTLNKGFILLLAMVLSQWN